MAYLITEAEDTGIDRKFMSLEMLRTEIQDLTYVATAILAVLILYLVISAVRSFVLLVINSKRGARDKSELHRLRQELEYANYALDRANRRLDYYEGRSSVIPDDMSAGAAVNDAPPPII